MKGFVRQITHGGAAINRRDGRDVVDIAEAVVAISDPGTKLAHSESEHFVGVAKTRMPVGGEYRQAAGREAFFKAVDWLHSKGIETPFTDRNGPYIYLMETRREQRDVRSGGLITPANFFDGTHPDFGGCFVTTVQVAWDGYRCPLSAEARSMPVGNADVAFRLSQLMAWEKVVRNVEFWKSKDIPDHWKVAA